MPLELSHRDIYEKIEHLEYKVEKNFNVLNDKISTASSLAERNSVILKWLLTMISSGGGIIVINTLK